MWVYYSLVSTYVKGICESISTNMDGQWIWDIVYSKFCLAQCDYRTRLEHCTSLIFWRCIS